MLGPFHFSLSLTTVSPNPNPPEVPTPARQHRVGPGRLMSLIRSTWGAGGGSRGRRGGLRARGGSHARPARRDVAGAM